MSFIPMYILGIMGATRRLDHYDASTGWQPLFIIMLLGGIVIAIGVALQLVQIIASVMQKRRLIDTTGDPWDGRTMEWAVPSPAPFYNYTTIPDISSRDAFYEYKKQGGLPKQKYEDIRMPKNTATGIYISAFAFAACFAFVWHVTWLAVVGIIGIIVTVIVRTFNEDIEYTIPAAQIKKFEANRVKNLPAKPAEEGEDMGLREFIRIVVTWGVGVVRYRNWRGVDVR